MEISFPSMISVSVGLIVKLKACSLSAGELVLQLIIFMALYKITCWIFYGNDVTLGKRSKCICTLLIVCVCVNSEAL